MESQISIHELDVLLQDISFDEVMQELAPYLFKEDKGANLVYVWKTDFSQPCFLLQFEPLNNDVVELTTATEKRPYRAKEKRKKSQYVIANIEKVLSIA